VLKKITIGVVIAGLIVLVFVIRHEWIGEIEKAHHMQALCEGELGYGDVGFGFEALCIYNGFPLRWENEKWILSLPIYNVEGG